MTILHVTSHLDIGGITTYVLSLAGRLTARGHEVIVAAGDGERSAELAGLGAAYWPLPLRTSSIVHPRLLLATRRLTVLARRHHVQVVHAHTRISQVIGQRVARACGIPFVTTWHGAFQPKWSRRWWPCTGDTTIAISEPVRQHLCRAFHVPDRRIRLIHNGVDAAWLAQPPEAAVVQAYRAASGLTAPGPVIGSLGRLASGSVKGFDLLLAAAGYLVKEFPSLRVVIVGEGSGRSALSDTIDRMGLRGHVLMPGTASDVRIPLAVMDVFVFPSRRQEGFGLALIEAMAAGKPVVAARIGAGATVIDDGRNGLLTPLEDAAAMAEAVARLLRDPDSAARMGHAGQERVRAHFSLDGMTDQVEAVYREAIANKTLEAGTGLPHHA